MKRPLILALVVALPFPTIAYSRVGETIAQCEERYGPHLKATDGVGPLDELRMYVKNSFNIILGFSHGVCQMATFTKVDDSAFSDVERTALLQANAGSSTWQPLHDFSMDLKWQRLDGEEFALYQTFIKRMGFTSKAYLAALNSAQDAQQKKALDGF